MQIAFGASKAPPGLDLVFLCRWTDQCVYLCSHGVTSYIKGLYQRCFRFCVFFSKNKHKKNKILEIIYLDDYWTISVEISRGRKRYTLVSFTYGHFRGWWNKCYLFLVLNSSKPVTILNVGIWKKIQGCRVSRIEPIRIFYIGSDHSYRPGPPNWLYLHEYGYGSNHLSWAK